MIDREQVREALDWFEHKVLTPTDLFDTRLLELRDAARAWLDQGDALVTDDLGDEK